MVWLVVLVTDAACSTFGLCCHCRLQAQRARLLVAEVGQQSPAIGACAGADLTATERAGVVDERQDVLGPPSS